MSNPTRYDLRVTDDGAGLYATDEPNTNGMQYVMANSYEALRAERDRMAEALDRQVPLHDAIQRAAGELPEGWEIRLCVEHHAGWVELIGPDGTEDFATNNERLDYTVIDALEHAQQGEQP